MVRRGPCPVPSIPQCSNECWGFDGTRDWFGQFIIQPGQLDLIGCMVGCFPCEDNPIRVPPMATMHGERWLRAHRVLNNRLANGMVGDLRSARRPWTHPPTTATWEVRRYPDYGIAFERAPCWDNSGRECFEHDACDCWPLPRTSPPVGNLGSCPDDTGAEYGGNAPIGSPIPGLMFDENFFEDARWGNPSSGWMWCRMVTDHGPSTVRVFFSGIGNVQILRTEDCYSNLLIPCTAKAPTGHDCDSRPPGSDPFYIGSDIRRCFDEVEIKENRAIITGRSSNCSLINKARLRAQNEVLLAITTTVFPGDTDRRFLRLEYRGRESTGQMADLFQQGWSNPDLPCYQLPVIDPANIFGECTLRDSGCRVRPELAMTSVLITLQLTAHSVSRKPQGLLAKFVEEGVPNQHAVYPFCRMRIDVTCAVRAELIDTPCYHTFDWLPENHPDFGEQRRLIVVNAENPVYVPRVFCHKPAVVIYADDPSSPGYPQFGDVQFVQRDRIIFRNLQGVVFDPPDWVRWEGMLGATTDPAVDDIWGGSDVYQLDGPDGICCHLLRSLNNLEVHGAPYLAETRPDDPKQVCTGFMRLGFGTAANCFATGGPCS